MVPKSLSSLVAEHNILVAIVADTDDGGVRTVGNRKDLESDDLIVQLFGDADAVTALNRSLEGQVLPRTWSQGKVSCVVCKPDENRIVGLLYHETRSAAEQYAWSKRVNEDVRALFDATT